MQIQCPFSQSLLTVPKSLKGKAGEPHSQGFVLAPQFPNSRHGWPSSPAPGLHCENPRSPLARSLTHKLIKSARSDRLLGGHDHGQDSLPRGSVRLSSRTPPGREGKGPTPGSVKGSHPLSPHTPNMARRLENGHRENMSQSEHPLK